MNTIAFVEMPAHGHVNPSLPIVQELVRRGERVVYYDSDEFRRQIEAAGATFRAYPAETLTSTDIAVATQCGDLARVPGVLLRATESLFPFLQAELARLQPDVVVLDSNALWGHMVARTLHLPTVSLMTTFMPGPAQFARLTPREWIHMVKPMLPSLPSVIGARSRLVRRFGKSAFPRPAFPARGGLNIGLFPRDFQPGNAGVDDTFRFVGPTIDVPASSGLPASIGDIALDTLAPGPVVYISLGTLHLGSPDFFRQCFEAFTDVPARFVLSVGQQVDIQTLGDIPSNCIVRQSVPQLEVLGHAAVFVTHGGMNSVLEGLWCGVPLVVIPQHFEQLTIGLNVAAHGAGIVLREHVAGKRMTAARLRGGLQRILADSRFREAASAEQKSLRQTHGFVQAADEIQAYVARSSAPREVRTEIRSR
jgi:MGT family glycosyltransferase